MTLNVDIRALIRTVPDFPKPGVLFRDITTLLRDAAGFTPSSKNWRTPIATATSRRSRASSREDSSSVRRLPID
jgi:adenine/guanine phosphoribosyltransferase-like PRPP-binding protein